MISSDYDRILRVFKFCGKIIGSSVFNICSTFEDKQNRGAPRIWGEGLFIFRELGSSANYFRGAGEQAHLFGDLWSAAKKLKK